MTLEEAEHKIVEQQKELMEASNRMNKAWQIINKSASTSSGGRHIKLLDVQKIHQLLK